MVGPLTFLFLMTSHRPYVELRLNHEKITQEQQQQQCVRSNVWLDVNKCTYGWVAG